MSAYGRRFWVVIASRDHVKQGMEEGIAQACHGKKTMMTRVHPGDGILYYSPKLRMQDKVSTCKRFTAVGTVSSDTPYQVDRGNGFMPFRIDVDYKREIKEVPWDDVKRQIGFQARLRFGFLEVSEEEFNTIADLMITADDNQDSSKE